MIRDHIILTSVILCLFIPILFGCGEDKTSESFMKSDSLNKVSYELHYKDLYASTAAATKAYNLSENNSSQRAEALNNLAFCLFMRMDFEKSKEFSQRVYNESNNQLEALIADINMMKIYQRTAQYKNFYDYRNSALQRVKRIDDDILSLTDKEQIKRFNYAKSELDITSSIFYYYLQQDKQALEAINNIDEENELTKDTAQKLYYYYMKGSGGLYEDKSKTDIVKGEFDLLLKCMEISYNQNYLYFEANASQAMAELMINRDNYEILKKNRPGALRLLNRDNLEWKDLTKNLSERAIKLFKKYGDWYQTACSYRTLATYYNEIGDHKKALEQLSMALSYVNKHHQRYYGNNNLSSQLATYIPNDTTSTEIKWINDKNINTIPEWIARLREQLSVTYALMNKKPESDYNRNIYLDILNYTRQDKELESRYNNLMNESKLLSALLITVIVGILVVIILFWILNKRWKKRNNLYISKLKRTIEICQRITSSVSPNVNEIKDVINDINRSIGDDINELLECKSFKIIENNEENKSDKRFTLLLPIQGTEKDNILGYVLINYKNKLLKEDKTLLRVIIPYISWTIENAITFISLGEERDKFEKERYIHQQHIIEDKRKNIEKKACLFVVNEMTPYIERIINEVAKLTSPSITLSKKVKENKIKYIDELITRINEYNDIIAIWIKMRRGSLSLNIENFELQSLFDVVTKGKKTFELNNQTLNVKPTKAIIKADKALTMFMINTLAENARKYTPKNGTIEIYAEECDNWVEISIKDNGNGLSKEDIDKIINDKVYDSATIGMSDSSNTKELKNKKGYGFGLINCKGIIEKYKKTNELFRVCKFDIESERGKGSRFFFRLPKGIIRAMMTITVVLLSMSCSINNTQYEGEFKSKHNISYDSLIVIANNYANKVYERNINGEYISALSLADSALNILNQHHSKFTDKTSENLSLKESKHKAEEKWFDDKFDTDYYTILDLRNEAAVAFLAIGDINNYKYNNNIYTSLYKKISRDISLEQYCKKMERSANNMTIAIILCIALLISLAIGYYIIYLRHRIMYRLNMEQVLEINNKIYEEHIQNLEDNKVIASHLVNQIYRSLNELIQISELSVGIYNSEEKKIDFAFANQENNDEMIVDMQKSFNKRIILFSNNSFIKCFPLWVEMGEEKKCIGVMAIKSSEQVNIDKELMLEIICGYLAVVIYNAVVIMNGKHKDIETAHDDARRSIREENRLHIQNMVLDNCLSTIKHETIYYPNKIKQIVGKLDSNKNEQGTEQIDTIKELISYYKDIFSLLTSCASRQLDEITFRRESISTDDIVKYSEKYFTKITSKKGINATLKCSSENYIIKADIIELNFMMENLINYALNCEKNGFLELKIYKENNFIRFDFTDTREDKSQEELNSLFYPNLSRMKNEDNDRLKGVELLICKQIIRDHDNYTGHRGCRINASQSKDGGYTIWFTIPE